MKHQFPPCIYTLEDQQLEPEVMMVWKMIFIFNWVIFRFQPLIFRGVHVGAHYVWFHKHRW